MKYKKKELQIYILLSRVIFKIEKPFCFTFYVSASVKK